MDIQHTGVEEVLQNGILENDQETGDDVLSDDFQETEAVSSEELFAAYREGKSLEELNGMLFGGSKGDTELSGATPDGEGQKQEHPSDQLTPATPYTEEPPEEPMGHTGNKEHAEMNAHERGEKEKPAPYQVYETKEDFQRHLDFEWNKRYRETREQYERQEREMAHVRKLLAGVLQVSEDEAVAELARRRFTMEAEEKGIENPEQYATLRRVQEENEQLRRQAQTFTARQEAEQNARRQVEEIRRQGDELTRKVSGFDLDKAMENDSFRRTVFSLHQAGEKDAVLGAYRAVFFEDYIRNAKREAAPAAGTHQPIKVTRPKEGGAAHGAGGQVKPMDFSRMSQQEIAAIEKRILNGEKIQI